MAWKATYAMEQHPEVFPKFRDACKFIIGKLVEDIKSVGMPSIQVIETMVWIETDHGNSPMGPIGFYDIRDICREEGWINREGGWVAEEQPLDA